MQVLPAKRREENCTGQYSRGSRNQNREHLVNIRETNILEIPYREVERTLRPIESTNNIIKTY